jgi:hypothetical protein
MNLVKYDNFLKNLHFKYVHPYSWIHSQKKEEKLASLQIIFTTRIEVKFPLKIYSLRCFFIYFGF